MRALLISADAGMRSLLTQALREQGHDIVVGNGTMAGHGEEDILVYDLAEATAPRWEELAQWRRAVTMPFVVLGPADPTEYAIMALQQGADDYVRRPIRAGELMARMEALLRRLVLVKGQPVPKVEEALILERGGCSARIGPRHVSLTPAEFRVLELLQQRRGQTVSRHELSSVVWGHHPSRAKTNLSLFILHLRRKIEANPAYPQVIVTRWGSGYTLADAELAATALTAS